MRAVVAMVFVLGLISCGEESDSHGGGNFEYTIPIETAENTNKKDESSQLKPDELDPGIKCDKVDPADLAKVGDTPDLNECYRTDDKKDS